MRSMESELLKLIEDSKYIVTLTNLGMKPALYLAKKNGGLGFK